MVRVSVSPEQAKQYPREYGLLVQLAGGSPSGGDIDSKALSEAAAKYGDAEQTKALGDAPSFEQFAKAFQKPSQADGVEGDGSVLGYAARDNGAVLSPWKFERRPVGDKDVRLQIAFVGMCHSDLHTINGDWGEVPYPMVPGHEIVGFVSEVGPKVSKVKVGDCVGVGCFVDSCRGCGACQRGDQHFCPTCTFTYNAKYKDGTQSQGGYSTHYIMDEEYVLRIPKGIPLHRAAPLLCAGITTWNPYKDHGLDQPGKKVGVVGLGGLGHMAVKFGAAFGCEVTVISRSRAKEAEALAMGASKLLPTKDEGALKDYANYFDGIIDTVSAEHDLNQLLGLLAPKGSLVMVGLPPGTLPLAPANLIMKQCSLSGSLIGNLKQTQEMLDFCGEHNIGCDVEVIDAPYVNEAMKRMVEGDVKFRFVIDVQKSMVA